MGLANPGTGFPVPECHQHHRHAELTQGCSLPKPRALPCGSPRVLGVKMGCRGDDTASLGQGGRSSPLFEETQFPHWRGEFLAPSPTPTLTH